jgi:hypothetical protein
VPEQERRLEAAEYLAAPPDAFGDIEGVDGLVVYNRRSRSCMISWCVGWPQL